MNGIKAYWRETLERWWNYRGLWRESLNDQPSAAFVYRGLLISYICLYVLFVLVNPLPYQHVNGVIQSGAMFILPPIEKWIPITLFLMIPFIVYGVLWHWGKIKNNRHVISVLMYLMIFIIGWMVVEIVGNSYETFKPVMLEASYYDAYDAYYVAYREARRIWYGLFFYLTIPTLLVSPILVMWIQGWRQALIFSMIVFLPYYLILRVSAGKGT